MSGEPLPSTVLVWLVRVEARWRARGLDLVTRSGLTFDLAGDLREALEGGAAEEELVAEDPAAFADRLAEANGVPLAEPPPRRVPTARAVITVGLAGALVGGAVSWVFLLPVSYPLLDAAVGSPVSEIGSILVVYLMLGACTVASAAAAIGWSFRADARTPRLLRFVTPGIVLFGIASIAPTMGLAALFGYSTSAAAVVLEALLVAAFVGSGIWLGHWVSLRHGPSGLARSGSPPTHPAGRV